MLFVVICCCCCCYIGATIESSSSDNADSDEDIPTAVNKGSIEMAKVMVSKLNYQGLKLTVNYCLVHHNK